MTAPGHACRRCCVQWVDEHGELCNQCRRRLRSDMVDLLLLAVIVVILLAL